MIGTAVQIVCFCSVGAVHEYDAAMNDAVTFGTAFRDNPFPFVIIGVLVVLALLLALAGGVQRKNGLVLGPVAIAVSVLCIGYSFFARMSAMNTAKSAMSSNVLQLGPAEVARILARVDSETSWYHAGLIAIVPLALGIVAAARAKKENVAGRPPLG